jgi:polar amino acid transport system substrate-binding protein
MKKKIGILLVLTLLIGAFAIGCGGQSEDPSDIGGETDQDLSLVNIQDKGVLVLGCDDGFPPMGFRDKAGNIVGFDIDLAQAVAEKLGVELEIKAINWDTKEMELNNGGIDVIWNGFTITSLRDQEVEFTKPYLNNEIMLAVRADSSIMTKDDLAGKILGYQVESSADVAVKGDSEFNDSLGDAFEYDDYQDALLDLTKSSRIDAVAVDKVLIEYVAAQEPGTIRILDEALGTEYMGIGCAKGSIALREAIDNALDELQQDGTVEAITNEWFGTNVVIRDVEKLSQEQIINMGR